MNPRNVSNHQVRKSVKFPETPLLDEEVESSLVRRVRDISKELFVRYMEIKTKKEAEKLYQEIVQHLIGIRPTSPSLLSQLGNISPREGESYGNTREHKDIIVCMEEILKELHDTYRIGEPGFKRYLKRREEILKNVGQQVKNVLDGGVNDLLI